MLQFFNFSNMLHKKIIHKILGLFLGGLLTSCATGYDTNAVKDAMKNFVEKESGRTFKFNKFRQNLTEANSDINKFWAEMQAVDDNRVRLYMMAKVEDSIISIMNPEEVKVRYQKATKNAQVSDQCTEIVKQYFAPELVHAKMLHEQESFNINIHVEDELNQEKLGTFYYPKFKQIVKAINRDVLKDHYFVVNLYIFTDDFDETHVDYLIGKSDFGPTGDYKISCESGENSVCSSGIGLGSKLNNYHKKEIAEILKIENTNVLDDMSVVKALFPEDVDENGIRIYARYFGAIWDKEHKNVIDRKFVKINLFTSEMEWYKPQKFPR